MRPRVGVWTRTDRLEAMVTRAALRRDATRLALPTGVDPDTFIREAEALVARARAGGAITWEQITAWVAAELGIDQDELQAEAERIAARRAR